MHILDRISDNAMTIAACLASFAAGSVFVAATLIPADAKPQCMLIAETYSGDVYTLGVGDTCRDALRNHSPIPADAREVRTQMSNVQTRGVDIR